VAGSGTGSSSRRWIGFLGGRARFVGEHARLIKERVERVGLRPTRWFARDAAVRALSDGFVRQVPWWSTPAQDKGADGPAIVIGATEIGYGVDWVFMDPNAPRGHTGASATS